MSAVPHTVLPWHHLVAGASSGIATAVFTSPLDVLRTRFQANFYQLQGFPSSRPLEIEQRAPLRSVLKAPVDHIRTTFSILRATRYAEGWQGLFRGLTPSLIGVVPATTIKFYTYGNCKRILSSSAEFQRNDVLVNSLSAVAAGFATATLTNPIWVIKTRLQLDHKPTGSSPAPRHSYRSTWDCVLQTMRTEGLRGMYRGLSASYLGAGESALHLVLYEKLKPMFAPEMRSSQPNGNFLAWLGLGLAAGGSKFITVLIAYPHEVVRTRLRQAPDPQGNFRYSGLVQCARLVWKEERLAGFYGGLTPHLMRAIPSAAITLSVYELVLRWLS